MIGTTLGHHKIAAKLGEGGMGVDCGAEDRNLNPQAIIEILPALSREDRRPGYFLN